MAPNAMQKASRNTRNDPLYYHESRAIQIHHNAFLHISRESMTVYEGRHLIRLRQVTRSLGSPVVLLDHTGHYLVFNDDPEGRRNRDQCQAELEGKDLFPDRGSGCIIRFDGPVPSNSAADSIEPRIDANSRGEPISRSSVEVSAPKRVRLNQPSPSDHGRSIEPPGQVNEDHSVMLNDGRDEGPLVARPIQASVNDQDRPMESTSLINEDLPVMNNDGRNEEPCAATNSQIMFTWTPEPDLDPLTAKGKKRLAMIDEH